MSPAKTTTHHHNHSDQNTLNGLRPSPLKINKSSHSIHKSSNSSSSSSNSSSTSAAAGASAGAPLKPRTQQPVIIYTHSPKVIHTQAKDFMALVQKLTGHSGAAINGGNRGNSGVAITRQRHESSEMNADRGRIDDNHESSSISGEDVNGGSCGGGDDHVSAILKAGTSHAHNLFAEIPLFTPNSSSNFFCSPKPVFRYPGSGYATPNADNLLSPSVFEFMRGLPEFN